MQPVNMPSHLSTGPWKEEPEEPTGDSYPSKVHRGIVKLCVLVCVCVCRRTLLPGGVHASGNKHTGPPLQTCHVSFFFSPHLTFPLPTSGKQP